MLVPRTELTAFRSCPRDWGEGNGDGAWGPLWVPDSGFVIARVQGWHAALSPKPCVLSLPHGGRRHMGRGGVGAACGGQVGVDLTGGCGPNTLHGMWAHGEAYFHSEKGDVGQRAWYDLPYTVGCTHR